jgi:hypothetical protein
MDTDVVDLRDLPAHAPVLEATVTFAKSQSRLRVRLPGGEAGRADAILGKRVWAAKHYWQEQDGVMVYEFDEPLPAGQVTLRVPLVQASR